MSELQLELELPDPSVDLPGAFHGAHADAPETERAAAELVEPRSGTDRLRVLRRLAELGDHGATDEELELDLGTRPYAVRSRRVELKKLGWVVDSGARRPTRSGATAAVWALSPAALEHGLPA